jgi:SnoaL-like domain
VTASVSGAEPKPFVLRVTTIFRREDGEWKVVHRHANAVEDSGEVVGRLAPPALTSAVPGAARARLPDPVGHLRDEFELALLGLLADEVPADGYRREAALGG